VPGLLLAVIEEKAKDGGSVSCGYYQSVSECTSRTSKRWRRVKSTNVVKWTKGFACCSASDYWQRPVPGCTVGKRRLNRCTGSCFGTAYL